MIPPQEYLHHLQVIIRPYVSDEGLEHLRGLDGAMARQAAQAVQQVRQQLQLLRREVTNTRQILAADYSSQRAIVGSGPGADYRQSRYGREQSGRQNQLRRDALRREQVTASHLYRQVEQHIDEANLYLQQLEGQLRNGGNVGVATGLRDFLAQSAARRMQMLQQGILTPPQFEEAPPPPKFHQLLLLIVIGVIILIAVAGSTALRSSLGVDAPPPLHPTFTPTVTLPTAAIRNPNAAQVTLRMSPTNSATALRYMNNGDRVMLLPDQAVRADGYTWWHVRTMERITVDGWVADKFLGR